MRINKLCPSGGETKLLAEFYTGCGRSRNQPSAYCKPCCGKKKHAQWRARNPIVRNRGAYLTADKYCPGCDAVKPIVEFAKAKCRPGGTDAYCKICKKANNRKLYSTEKATARAQRLKQKRHAINDKRSKLLDLMGRARGRAAILEVPFDLDIEYLCENTSDYCPVFGVKFGWWNTYGSRYTSPSLDRFDSTKGYVKGNVIVISWKANAMKQNATPEEIVKLAQWATRVAAEKSKAEFANDNLDVDYFEALRYSN